MSLTSRITQNWRSIAQRSLTSPLKGTWTPVSSPKHALIAKKYGNTLSSSTFHSSSISKNASPKSENVSNNNSNKGVLPITFFTANPNYYNVLMELNELIRKHNLSFPLHPLQVDQSTEPAQSQKKTAHGNWMSLLDMSNAHNMSLTEEMYQDLCQRLSILSQLVDTPTRKDIEPILYRFMKAGASIVKHKHDPEVVDEEGKSFTTGSRKTARAQAWLIKGNGQIFVNGVHFSEYFGLSHDREKLVVPFEATGTLGKYNVWAIVRGGGSTGQAGAISLAVSRGLVVHDPNLKPLLEEHGLLTPDIRQVERKKPGKPKARKSYTWVKR